MTQILLEAGNEVKKGENNMIFPFAELCVSSDGQEGGQSEALITLLEGDKSASYSNWTPT